MPAFLRQHRRTLWLGYWVALFVIMHIPEPEGLAPPVPHSDKVAHFIAYLVLTLLGGWYVRGRARFGAGVLVMWALVYIAYGALDEWLQQFVNRSTSAGDWLADASGVLIGTIVWMIAHARSRRRRSPPSPGPDGGGM